MCFKILLLVSTISTGQILASQVLISNRGSAGKYIALYDSASKNSVLIGGFESKDADNGHCAVASTDGLLTIMVPESLDKFGMLDKNSCGKITQTVSPLCQKLAWYITTNFAQPDSTSSTVIKEFASCAPEGQSYCAITFKPKSTGFKLGINTDNLSSKDHSMPAKCDPDDTTPFTCKLRDEANNVESYKSVDFKIGNEIGLLDLNNWLSQNNSSGSSNLYTINNLQQGSTLSQLSALPSASFGSSSCTGTFTNTDGNLKATYTCKTTGLTPNYTCVFNYIFSNNQFSTHSGYCNIPMDHFIMQDKEVFSCGFCAKAETATVGNDSVGVNIETVYDGLEPFKTFGVTQPTCLNGFVSYLANEPKAVFFPPNTNTTAANSIVFSNFTNQSAALTITGYNSWNSATGYSTMLGDNVPNNLKNLTINQGVSVVNLGVQNSYNSYNFSKTGPDFSMKSSLVNAKKPADAIDKTAILNASFSNTLNDESLQSLYIYQAGDYKKLINSPSYKGWAEVNADYSITPLNLSDLNLLKPSSDTTSTYLPNPTRYIISNGGKNIGANYKGFMAVYDSQANTGVLLGGYTDTKNDNGHCVSNGVLEQQVTILIPENLVDLGYTGENCKFNDFKTGCLAECETFVEDNSSLGKDEKLHVSPICQQLGSYIIKNFSDNSGMHSIGEYAKCSGKDLSYCAVTFVPKLNGFKLRVNTDLLTGENGQVFASCKNSSTGDTTCSFAQKNLTRNSCNIDVADFSNNIGLNALNSWLSNNLSNIQASGENSIMAKALLPQAYLSGCTNITAIGAQNAFDTAYQKGANALNDSLQQFESQELAKLAQNPTQRAKIMANVETLIKFRSSLVANGIQALAKKGISCAAQYSVVGNDIFISYTCTTIGYDPNYTCTQVYVAPNALTDSNAKFAAGNNYCEISGAELSGLKNFILQHPDVAGDSGDFNCGFCSRAELTPVVSNAFQIGIEAGAYGAAGKLFPFSTAGKSSATCANGFIAELGTPNEYRMFVNNLPTPTTIFYNVFWGLPAFPQVTGSEFGPKNLIIQPGSTQPSIPSNGNINSAYVGVAPSYIGFVDRIKTDFGEYILKRFSVSSSLDKDNIAFADTDGGFFKCSPGYQNCIQINKDFTPVN